MLARPSKFTKVKKELPGQLSNIKAYIRFYVADFVNLPDIILFAENFLDGAPKRQFELTFNDYLTKVEGERYALTTRIFNFRGFIAFEDKITKIFGESDEVKTAEERI